MSQAPEILVDSDAFVAYFVANDVHHENVTSIMQNLRSAYRPLATTNLVIAETASLLSRRFSFDLAVRFIAYVRIDSFPVIYIDPEMQQAGYEVFTGQEREGTSFVDCLNVIVVKHYGMSAILSFDKFYQRFGIEQVR